MPAPTDLFSRGRILVTGATGLFGRELVDRLLALGADLRTVSILPPPPDFPSGKVEHLAGDLADRSFAREAMKNVSGLFHLAGRRGSVGIQRKQGATMLGENLTICLNTLDAARRAGVERIVYTSTVTVYPPMSVYRENLAWSANPHPADEFVSWAKRIAEKFIEAQEVQYGVKNVAIVRPVNTFGPHDDFAPETALVVPALIGRALAGEKPFTVWGDGSAVRDFLFVADAVEGMLLAYQKGIGQGAINLGSGRGYSIKELVTAVLAATGRAGDQVAWDTSKPSGEPRKVADITRAREILGFAPKVDLVDAIRRTVDWYRANSARPQRH
ncbi:MAG TPA: NAD-dependent epimerase/dehydratase family protein [Reyranella sp.]|nr:NAD-dependent epimerase/dehydratase family protein [Reyranella sp.]